MKQDNITNKDVFEALKLFDKSGIVLENEERTKTLMRKKLTLEEVLRVVTFINYPISKYNMEAVKNISLANIMINKLIREAYDYLDDDEREKKIDELWADAEKTYDAKNKEETEKIAKTLEKAKDNVRGEENE